MKLFSRIIPAATIVATILTGCSGSPTWTVNGTIADAGGSTLVLEAPGRAGWYIADSVHVADNGSFAISQPAAAYPEVFRLNLGGRQIYFPIDSTETVTVTTSAAGFGTDYTLAGSTAAEAIALVDRRVRQAAGVDSLLKRELSGMLIGDPSSIVAYYIIRKQVGDKPIFDPANPADLRVIGAVANAYDQYRPDDPRTAQIKDLFLTHKGLVRGGYAAPTDTIYAAEIPLFDIKLYDNKGVDQSLSDIAAKHKAVILNFTLYTAEASPAINLQLAKVYDRFRDRGLEIYQVAADPDEYAWRQSASNLPWVTVYQTPVSPASNLLNYNVTSLPATYLIVNGEIRERIDDLSTVADAVDRVL